MINHTYFLHPKHDNYTWKQNDRMAGMGMMAAAAKAAMLQTEVVITDTPHLRMTLPTWSCKQKVFHHTVPGF